MDDLERRRQDDRRREQQKQDRQAEAARYASHRGAINSANNLDSLVRTFESLGLELPG